LLFVPQPAEIQSAARDESLEWRLNNKRPVSMRLAILLLLIAIVVAIIWMRMKRDL